MTLEILVIINFAMLFIILSKLRMQKASFKIIESTLDEIFKLVQPDTSAKSIKFFIIKDGHKVPWEDKMFLKSGDVVELSLEILDDKNQPAKVDGLPQWALTDATIGTLEVSADGMSAKLTSSGVVSKSKVQVKADADLGEGVEELLAESEELENMSGKATQMVLKAMLVVPPAP